MDCGDDQVVPNAEDIFAIPDCIEVPTLHGASALDPTLDPGADVAMVPTDAGIVADADAERHVSQVSAYVTLHPGTPLALAIIKSPDFLVDPTSVDEDEDEAAIDAALAVRYLADYFDEAACLHTRMLEQLLIPGAGCLADVVQSNLLNYECKALSLFAVSCLLLGLTQPEVYETWARCAIAKGLDRSDRVSDFLVNCAQEGLMTVAPVVVVVVAAPTDMVPDEISHLSCFTDMRHGSLNTSQ